MRILSARWLLFTCLAVLAACGSSPPVRYFRLNHIAADRAPGGTRVSPSVRLDPVVIPAELDRLELVRGSGANRVEIDDEQRWSAPLEEQIRQVLSDNLRLRLPEGSIADPHEAITDEPRQILSVSITSLEIDTHCAVNLQADWSLRLQQSPSRHGFEQIQMPGSAACADDVAVVMSRALAELATRLALQLMMASSGSGA